MSNKYVKKDPVDVPFTSVYLDPNNPRIAPEEPPGYDKPIEITNPDVQTTLEEAVSVAYKVESLMAAIQSEGWLPIDPIIVWELPKAKGKYVVIEGNTRVTVLRKLRIRLETTKQTLERASRAKKTHTPEAIESLTNEVAHLERIKAETVKIRALKVNAATPAELEDILPHLHSVRHINHAKQWSPYATNLYLLDEYRKLHRKKYPRKPLIKLDDELIKQVANLVSLKPAVARRNLQSAAAYSSFKIRYTSRLPGEDEFSDRDHYFFSIIMDKPFLREQFGVSENDIELDRDKEEVLFKWAFSKPRKNAGETEDEEGEENPNILHKAEALRDWDRIRKYDEDHHTGFHRRLDVEKPDEAMSMRKIMADYLNDKTKARSMDTLKGLLAAVKTLNSDDLVANGTQLTPILHEIQTAIRQRLSMIEAAAEEHTEEASAPAPEPQPVAASTSTRRSPSQRPQPGRPAVAPT